MRCHMPLMLWGFNNCLSVGQHVRSLGKLALLLYTEVLRSCEGDTWNPHPDGKAWPMILQRASKETAQQQFINLTLSSWIGYTKLRLTSAVTPESGNLSENDHDLLGHFLTSAQRSSWYPSCKDCFWERRSWARNNSKLISTKNHGITKEKRKTILVVLVTFTVVT